ncbi:hypothetical protein AGDE_15741 [Angomonas deanei]|uniref:Bromodomain, putative n=1 Tax=Angomonas deanei TaxID=59799 RepID=A0A7G2CMN2_9TRYP|nr:hypothetical protein AGDE_15741 [Angomonas deanei]CAD2220327.1 Bromodomain, putative [Angomonas deanei]|eukprot:EPY18547.1 hypothetical protein AGDE_15741 [Angomonas deanei]
MIDLFDQWGRDMQETVLCKSVSHTAVPSITPWQAAVRVVRLMAYHLLDDRWSFREGCATALREVLGESDSASLTVGEATHKGTVSLELGENTAVVPNTLRMVLLLSVLDLAWAEKELSGPFRYPVSEWEAPTYYRKIKDPVTLFSLYLEVCKGITPTALARVARRKKGKEQLEDVFMDYTELRERLMLMIGNCSQYNGPNSDITGIGNKLLELCLKAIRDAQFAEDGGEAYLEIQRARRVAEDGLGDHLLPTHRLFQLEELGALFPPVHVVATIQVSLPVAAEETATAAETDTGRKKRGKAGKSTSHKPEKVLKEKTVKSERTTEKPKRGRPPAPPEETVTEGFNLRCDRCGVYRRLPHPLNPPPVYWDCSYMGATCDEKNAANYIRMREKLFLDKDEDLPLTRRVKPAAKRARKRSPQKRRRPTPSNSSSSSSASSSTSSTDSSSASSSSSAPSAPRQDHRVELAKLTNEMNKLEQEPLTFKPFQQLQQLRQMQKHIVKLKK